MGFEIGLVGLPNVGKSTLFRAITSSISAEAANYPFCTIDPNVGVVNVPDSRLERLRELYRPEKVLPNFLAVTDIAGLIKGSSKGEGMGNAFLNHIRQVDAIIHLVRCFEDDNIIHVDGSVDPIRDIEVINTELILADLEQVERKQERTRKQLKGDKNAAEDLVVYTKLAEHLSQGKPARTFADENVPGLDLITRKPFFYVTNVAEDELEQTNSAEQAVKKLAESEGSSVVKICCSLEAELAEMEPWEKKAFLTEVGVPHSGLETVIREGFRLLRQISFFTAGEKEVRAWNVTEGDSAPQAAGKIHTDMRRGFIRCEVFHYDDIDALGSEQAVKESGKLRVEGKDYRIQDGDIIHVRFANV